VDDFENTRRVVIAHQEIPVYIRALESLLDTLKPRVLVDARMRKHSVPEIQHGLAPLTIALGPGFVAGRHADIVIETSWDDLGRVITMGSSLPLSGEPREIAGHARDRYVYAPIAGVFRTTARIGDVVQKGQPVALVESAVLHAPLDGVLRGLTRDGVPVSARTKVIEVDPRGKSEGVRGIIDRSRRIAAAAFAAIRTWEERQPR
jgi:xanthine dehydrogenase accessory factor